MGGIMKTMFRKSAAWSGGPADDDGDDFLEFGDSMYSDSSANKQSVQRSNSVGYTRNRAKITNHQVHHLKITR